MKTLNIQGLDFDSIKANFINFLKNDGKYNSWNFEGSNISSLLNIFSYAGHYIGYYAKMVLSESFIDSATQISSLYSKAKLTSYLPKGMRCARGLVNLTITTTTILEPLSKAIIIPRGSYFSGNNSTNDSRNFYVLDDVVCYNRTVSGGNVIYNSPDFVVYEGKLKTWRFIVDNAILNQRFIIQDYALDVDTIRVNVYPNVNPDSRIEFKYKDSMVGIDATSKVFYLSTSEEGYYEVYFGNNQFGIKPEHNTVIECTYIASNGNTGNGCNRMNYQKPNISLDTRQTTGSFDNFQTGIVETSSGGTNPETIEDLRFNIPNHFRRQNRIVTVDDYKTILLSEFRDIDSINVWGGETNYIKQYGTVFVSIKPKNTSVLSSAAKKEIQLLVNKYSVSGLPVIFKDPDYTKIDLDLFVTYDYTKTNKSSGEIKTIVLNKAIDYNLNYLDKFNAGLSDIALLEYIKTDLDYIISIYDTKVLRRQLEITYRSGIENVILFGNKLKAGAIQSSRFYYGRILCVLYDDGKGNLHIKRLDTGVDIVKNIFGSVDYINGIIKFTLNIDIVSVTDYGNSGLIEFRAIPEIPDVNTYQNNILLLENITVHI